MAINIQNLMTAIFGQESGGNYGAVNPVSGALGKYQILPSNLASWGANAGYPGITPSQFLSNPAAQDAIAQTQLQTYANQYGDVGSVAQAWYSGPGNVGSNVSGGIGYPDSNSYASQVTARYDALGGDASGGYGSIGNPSGAPIGTSTIGTGSYTDMGDYVASDVPGSAYNGDFLTASGTNTSQDITGLQVAGVNAPAVSSAATSSLPSDPASAYSGSTSNLAGMLGGGGGTPVNITDLPGLDTSVTQGAGTIGTAATNVGKAVTGEATGVVTSLETWLGREVTIFLLAVGGLIMLGVGLTMFGRNHSPTAILQAPLKAAKSLPSI